jgi:hypothetical protein
MDNDSRGSIPERRYTDAEVRALLERATREERPGSPARRTTGLTLAELEDVAREAGIDVARLRDAARELSERQSAGPAGAIARLAGAPLRVRIERTLPFEIDDAALERLVMTVGSALDESGDTQIVGRTFVWKFGSNAGRRTEVRVSVDRGTTVVRIEERYGELAGGLYGGVLGGVGGGVGLGAGVGTGVALGSTALAFALPALVIGGSYAACRAGLRAYVRNRSLKLSALTDTIVRDLNGPREVLPAPGDQTPE